MPNHVTNIIKAEKEVLHSLLTEDGVDFNRVIPQPDDDDPIFTATKHTHTHPETGEVFGVGWSMDGYSPLDWNREHWGTKWNAYDEEIDDENGRIQFDTAWSHPLPVIYTLSKQHPEAEIEVLFADEDLGQNLAHYIMKDGVITHMWEIEEGTDLALDFAAQVKYGISGPELKKQWEEDERQFREAQNG